MKYILALIPLLSIGIILWLMSNNKENNDHLQEEHITTSNEKIIKNSSKLAVELSNILQIIGSQIKPGMSVNEIDKLIIKEIKKTKRLPAMLGYHGFPASSCISINEQVLHTIPSEIKIKKGDLVTIQTGLRSKEGFSNQGWTFRIGNLSEKKQHLYDTGLEALKKAIDKAKPGIQVGDISNAIQKTIEKEGFSVIRDYVGFGMGRSMHQDPAIPCHGESNSGPVLKAGTILNIHVIASTGNFEVIVGNNGWDVSTSDKSSSVLFSAMVLIEKSGAKQLSKLIK